MSRDARWADNKETIRIKLLRDSDTGDYLQGLILDPNSGPAWIPLHLGTAPALEGDALYEFLRDLLHATGTGNRKRNPTDQ